MTRHETLAAVRRVLARWPRDPVLGTRCDARRDVGRWHIERWRGGWYASADGACYHAYDHHRIPSFVDAEERERAKGEAR